MATDKKKLEINQRYLDKLERITIRVRRDGTDGFTVADLRKSAERDGMSVNAWLVNLIRDNI